MQLRALDSPLRTGQAPTANTQRLPRKHTLETPLGAAEVRADDTPQPPQYTLQRLFGGFAKKLAVGAVLAGAALGLADRSEPPAPSDELHTDISTRDGVTVTEAPPLHLEIPINPDELASGQYLGFQPEMFSRDKGDTPRGLEGELTRLIRKEVFKTGELEFLRISLGDHAAAGIKAQARLVDSRDTLIRADTCPPTLVDRRPRVSPHRRQATVAEGDPTLYPVRFHD